MSEAGTTSASERASKNSTDKNGRDEQVHSEELEVLLSRLGVSSSAGLEEREAANRLAKYGKNKLPEPARKSTLMRLLEQFANPLVLTLLAAAAIAVVVGFTDSSGERGLLSRFGDAIAILLIVILNAFLGYYQERRAEAALEAAIATSPFDPNVHCGLKAIYEQHKSPRLDQATRACSLLSGR